MHPEITARLEAIEPRRKSLTDRVKALPAEKQVQKPTPKDFSPVEVLMHTALAEGYDVDQIKRSKLDTKARAKPSFLYRYGLKSMFAGKAIPTMKEMVPRPGVTLEQAEEAWQKVRKDLASLLEKTKDPEAPLVKIKMLGVLSARNVLELMEAHLQYHDLRFPKV